jgi:hypothetical protein
MLPAVVDYGGIVTYTFSGCGLCKLDLLGEVVYQSKLS